jgi:hypothetical protein
MIFLIPTGSSEEVERNWMRNPRHKRFPLRYYLTGVHKVDMGRQVSMWRQAG